ncbi:DHH family phosphoesterase [Nitriliruptor alkaliphilus]|uniref:DHH family phosphoesterase n=1 Tax=Nitriliruptor alkaliphilus TaxID=427918 RepID=UPI00069738C4|nr:bifunctional oligoribonuclease/PAP phosphatase NrnA [Nitriliruptor alkaliphilus]
MTSPPAPWLSDVDPDAVDEAVTRLQAATEDGASVVIAAHIGPDGDALGAALALHHALSGRGARTLPTWGEEPLRVPAAYADLPGVDDLVAPSDIDPEAVDLLVSVDSSSASRLGALEPLLGAGVPTIVVDHHPTNTRFGTVHLVAPRAAATVVIVDELLRRLEVPLDPDIATCLYVGLVTDTGRFQHASTDRAAMELGGRLIDAGAPHEELTRRLFGTRTVGELTLLARALARLTFVPEASLVHAFVTAEDLEEAGAGMEAAEAIIDVVRTTDVAEVAVVAREAVGSRGWRVSLRSRGQVDVGRIATAFGGGGHDRASGFTGQGTYDEVLASIVAAVQEA